MNFIRTFFTMVPTPIQIDFLKIDLKAKGANNYKMITFNQCGGSGSVVSGKFPASRSCGFWNAGECYLKTSLTIFRLVWHQMLTGMLNNELFRQSAALLPTHEMSGHYYNYLKESPYNVEVRDAQLSRQMSLYAKQR